jgi:hypothetical protein
MSYPWGDMTDAEFVAVRDRIGDMAYENPELAKAIVRDMRRERDDVREDCVPVGTTLH